MNVRIFYVFIFFALCFLQSFCTEQKICHFVLPKIELPRKYKKSFSFRRAFDLTSTNPNFLIDSQRIRQICEPDFSQSTNLEQLVGQVVAQNPKLSARQVWVDALELKAKRARLPKDPKFKYYNKDNEHLGQDLYKRERRYGLYQKIPFPGKLRLKMEAEYKNAEFFVTREASVMLDLTLEAKKLYQKLYLNHTTLEIMEKYRKKVAQLLGQLDNTDELDALEAKINYGKLVDKMFALEKRQKALESKINALLNVPLSTPIAKPQAAFHGKILFDTEQLLHTAIRNRPEVMGRHALIDKHRTKAKLARRNYFPDVDLEILIQRKKDYDRYAWYLKVGFELPIWANLKQRRDSQEQEAKALSHLLGLQHLKNEMGAKINSLVFDIQALDHRIDLYEHDVLPAAQKIFAIKKHKYEAGEIKIVKMIVEIMLVEKIEILYAEYKAEREILIAKLEREIGIPL